MSLLLALWLAAQIEVSPASCTLARAERITFEAAVDQGPRLNRRCVALHGIWAGRALYRNMAQTRLAGAEIVAANARDRVGISAPDAITRRSPRPDSYLVVGILYDCSVFEGEEVFGYCHFHRRGPFIAVTYAFRRHWPTLRAYP